MCGSAPGRTKASRRLSLGRPSCTTGPSSLPLSTCSRVSNESPAFCLVSPWQEKHSSRSKTTALRPSESPELDEVAAADSNSTEAQRAPSQNPSCLGMLWITRERGVPRIETSLPAKATVMPPKKGQLPRPLIGLSGWPRPRAAPPSPAPWPMRLRANGSPPPRPSDLRRPK